MANSSPKKKSRSSIGSGGSRKSKKSIASSGASFVDYDNAFCSAAGFCDAGAVPVAKVEAIRNDLGLGGDLSMQGVIASAA